MPVVVLSSRRRAGTALTAKLGSPTVLPLAARTDGPALRIILRARKGGRAAFRLLAPLVLHQGTSHDRDGAVHHRLSAAEGRRGL